MRAISALLFCFSTFLAYSQQYDYAKLLGGVAGDARGQGIVRDNAGNIFMKGVFTGGLQIGSSIYKSDKGDAFFCKNDIAGNFQWFKKVGFTQAEDWTNTGDGDIAIDASNNIYITGSFFGNATIEGNVLVNEGGYDIYVIKYDQNGNLIWIRTIGGPDDEGGNGITVDGAGNVFISGGTWGNTLNFNGSPQNTGKVLSSERVAYIASLNPDGSDNWITFKRTASQRNELVDLVLNGSSVLATGVVSRRAYLASYVTSTGVLEWETSASSLESEGYGIAINGTSAYIGGQFRTNDLQFGTLPPNSFQGGWDMFVAEFDISASGNPLNSISYGTTSDEGIRDISVSSGTPEVCVTGFYNADLTIGSSTMLDGGPFVATFDINLNPILAAGLERVGDNFRDTSLGIATSDDAENAIYTTGTYQGIATINGNQATQKTNTFFIQRHKASTLALDFSKVSPHGEIIAQFIKTDNSDNIYLAGYFDGSVDLIGTRISSIETSSDESVPLHDLFVAKLNPDASLDWVATAGGLDNDLVYGLTIDGEGSVYINAEFPNTATVAGTGSASGKSIVKLDNTGNFVYAASFPAGAEITAIEGDKYLTSDKLYAVGYFTGSIDLQGTILNTAGPDTDIFIVRLDGSGVITPATIKQYGGPGDDIASDITQIFLYSATEMLVTGSIQATVDFNGTLLTADATDVFVTRIDEFLNAFDSFNDGGPGDQEGLLVSPDASNNVVVAGNFYGTADFNASTLLNGGTNFTSHFIAKYQNNGSFVWAKEIVSSDASSNNFLTSIAADGNDNIFLSGTLTNDLDFDGNVINALGDNDGFIVQYDIGGNYVFADALGSTYASGAEAFIGFEFGYGVATTSNDEVWITGTLTVKDETFGPYTLKPYAVDDPGQSYGMDAYLARYNTQIVPTAGSKIYWTEEAGNQINRCNLDGTFFEQYYSGFSIFPQGLACDETNGFMYWTDTNGKVRRGKVGLASFDPPLGLDFIDQSSGSRRDNLGISIDEAGDKIYWVSNWDGTIKSATLSAPVPISTLQTPVSGLSNPISVAIDPAAGILYYTENNDPGDNIGEIHKYDIGVGSDVILYSRQTPGEDFLFNDIKLDLTNNMIYWSGGEDIGGFPGPGEIFYANLSNVSGTVNSFATPGFARGIDLDISGGKIYWVDRGVVSALPARIMRANLDGSNQEILREGVSENISSPNFIAVEIENLAPPVLTFISSTPNFNSINVAVSSNITLNFVQDVDGTSANGTNIIITGDQTGLIQGVFSGGGTSDITFDPTNNFKAGELIRVTLTTGLLSTVAAPLATSYEFEFRAAVNDGPETPDFFADFPANHLSVSQIAETVYAADIDGDGDIDIIGGLQADQLSWFENNGSQNFTEHVVGNIIGILQVYAADVDSDGDMDLIAQGDDTFNWFENDGSENFTPHVIDDFSPSKSIGQSRPVDLDGDGDLDFVITYTDFDEVGWYENDGAENFTFISIDNSATATLSIWSVDINGDGFVDVLATYDDNTIAIYYNDGSQNFTQDPIAVLWTDVPVGLTGYAADMDGDGDIDLIFSNNDGRDNVWLENDGLGGFTERDLVGIIGGERFLMTDMDGDADMDILAGKFSEGVFWYENDGSENFTEHQITSVSNWVDVYLVDMDSDGDLDVAVTDGELVWYENTTIACPLPPSANAGVNQSICQGSTVSLSGSITNAVTPTWSTSGDGTFDNINNLTAVYTPGASDITGGSVMLTLSTEDPDGAGPCVAATSSVTITIDAAATVSAGPDIAICPSDAVGLTATIGGSANNPIWTSSGSGGFDDNTSLTALYTPDANDVSNGTVDLTLTVDAAGVCPQVADLLTISIAQPIAAGSLSIQSNVNVISNVDVISSSTINAGDVITTTIIQNPTKGSVSILANNSVDYIPNNGTIGADSFLFRICNQCGDCSDGTVTIDILNLPPLISNPQTPITTVAGQIVVIPFSTFITDPNDNIDFNSIQVVSVPTSGATTSFDGNYDLTVDYSTVGFVGTDALTVEVCDLLGACAQITLTIEVDGSIIPFNGMSPNGDGLNDYFKINNIQFIEPQNKVSIYNRWGDKVFDVDNYDNTNPEKRFNGISNGSKELPSGVYFYKVEFPSGRATMTGYLTIKK